MKEKITYNNMKENESRILPLEIRRQFEFNQEKKDKMLKEFSEDLDKGLKGEPGGMPMLPAFTDIPSGNEQGDYLAIDLGGTNLRVMRVNLNKGRANVGANENFPIPKEMATSSKDEFFGYIAEVLKGFLKDEKLEGEFSLGFTFSHAIEQTGLNSGKILNFSKGYNISDALGTDPVKELERSLAKKGVKNIKIKALSNDTVGTLACGGYADKNCDMGIVLGTGTNAAYRERTENITKQDLPESGEYAIVNTEWCDFDKLEQNEFDKTVDAKLGGGRLEKMVAGFYLGALLKEVMKELSAKSILSKGVSEKLMREETELPTEVISLILSDKSEDLKMAEKALSGLGFTKTEPDDRKAIKEAAEIILERSINIAAAAAAGLIRKMDPGMTGEHNIAIDGSLYEKIPGYKEKLEAEIENLLNKKINTFLSKDGSGIGAAILAASN